MQAENGKKKLAAKIATIVIMVIMCSVFLLDIMTVLFFNHYEKRYPVAPESFAFIEQGRGNRSARIHFLNTENSDAVLLESDGHFALIDSGWGSENPNARGRQTGYEERVLDYLKKVAAGEDGVVRLDFILATHYHYDHAGGFARILADPAIEVGVAWLRRLEPSIMKMKHVEDIYRQVSEAAARRGIPIEAAPAEPVMLGSMELQFFNLESYENRAFAGENNNSIVTLVSVGGTRALLTADITGLYGLEKWIGRQVGQVDLLTLSHHGYSMSNSMALLRELRPKLAIVSNELGKVYPNVKWNLVMGARAPYYSTVRENGIIAHLGEDGDVRLTGELH